MMSKIEESSFTIIYSDHVVMFSLTLSGGNDKNPESTHKPSCKVCAETVEWSNNKLLMCKVCQNLQHMKCCKDLATICYLNTHSVESSFTHFQLIVCKVNLDIITLSKLCLKNKKCTRIYQATWLEERERKKMVLLVSIYLVRRERKMKTGVVGTCVKDSIKNKVKNHVGGTDETLEHLWIEVQIKNKRSPFFIELVHQPCSENA